MTTIPAAPDKDGYAELLAAEFRDYASDRLAGFDECLDGVRRGSAGDTREALREMRQTAHNLKGMGASFGQPAISMLAQRLENYIFDLEDVAESNVGDIQVYSDRMRDVIEGRLELDEDGMAAFIRTLPAKPGTGPEESAAEGAEIMLVMPGEAVAHIVIRELQGRGYRVVNVVSPFEAFEQVVRTRPDVVIATAVMEDLSGVDLICALRAMPATAAQPLALLTSLDADSAELKPLPDGVPVIRKGRAFGDDLTAALKVLGMG